MGTTDLYVEGFPHGTKEGFEQGCRGAACPNHSSDVVTCKQAFSRHKLDYQFRKWVDAGRTPEEIAEIERAAKEQPAPVVEAEAIEPEAEAVEAEPEVEPEVEVLEAPKPKPPAKPKKERVPLVRGRHGAASHYVKGCRHESCVAAWRAESESLEGAEQYAGLYDGPEARVCSRCGEQVESLSSDDLCDGCVAEDAAAAIPIDHTLGVVRVDSGRYQELLEAEKELEAARGALSDADAALRELRGELELAKAAQGVVIPLPADGGRTLHLTFHIGA